MNNNGAISARTLQRSSRYPELRLTAEHEDLLLASAIAPSVATTRDYKSVDMKATLKKLGFSEPQRIVPGLLLPVFSPLTGEVVLHQYRPDEPRCDASGRFVKYETPRGARMAIDAHPKIREKLADPSVPLFITEGLRKGDSGVSHGLCMVTLLGVWNFIGRNERNGKVVIPELLIIAHNGRQEYIVFDSDVTVKPQVHEAMRWLKGILEHRGARVAPIYLPSGPGGTKVGLDDYLAAGHTVDDLLRLASPDLLPPVADRVAVSLSRNPNAQGQLREHTAVSDLSDLERQSAAVREAEDPFVRIEQAIRDQGYGGNVGPAKLTHLGMTTRVLRMRPGAMPAHLALVGQPSSGKNHSVNVNLRLLPAAAYHLIDAGSPRALIYDSAPLQHRVVIFGEADSLPAGEDNPAASAIRNLLQDHHLHYKVPVRDPKTGKHATQDVDKPGPTVLVTTATRRLGEQLESRLFVIEVPDDQEQLRAALAKQAAVELQGIPDPDPAVVAYQTFLQRRAPWDVIVPFVDVIGTALGRGPVAARVLRDFQKLIALVKATAVIRHPRRDSDSQGRVVASLEDYKPSMAWCVTRT